MAKSIGYNPLDTTVTFDERAFLSSFFIFQLIEEAHSTWNHLFFTNFSFNWVFYYLLAIFEEFSKIFTRSFDYIVFVWIHKILIFNLYINRYNKYIFEINLLIKKDFYIGNMEC